MELIVISSPEFLQDEARVINELFAAGMKRFHLRKPNASVAKLIELISAIDPGYRSEVVLHQQHELADGFSMHRRHYPEALRLIQAELLEAQKRRGMGLSTSIHKLEHACTLSVFDYVFFSPVFNSISKLGYHGTLSPEFRLSKSEGTPAIIALGGVDYGNIPLAMEMNFDGVAVLGAIWNKPGSPVEHFLRIQDCIHKQLENPVLNLGHD